MPAKKKPAKLFPEKQRLVHNDPALSRFPPVFRKVFELLNLAPDYHYIFFFAEKEPAADRPPQSGMMCTLVPMVEQPDGSVKPMRASIGMMVDFMLAVEKTDVPKTKTTDYFEYNDELPRHKM